MLTLIELTTCLGGLYSSSNIVQFLDVFESFFESTVSTTTRSLSRYSSQSLRSWFRFLRKGHDWVLIRVYVFKHFCFDESRIYLLVADETVEGKSGNHSHGISKFYSSTAGGAINGVCFFGMSLVDVQSKPSYLMGVDQVVYSDLDRSRIAASKAKKIKRTEMKKEGDCLKRGRKKGTKNSAEGRKYFGFV